MAGIGMGLPAFHFRSFGCHGGKGAAPQAALVSCGDGGEAPGGREKAADPGGIRRWWGWG